MFHARWGQLHSNRWKRIFPPREGQVKDAKSLETFWDRYSKVLYSDPKEGEKRKQELKDPSDLDKLTWDFVFWRQKQLRKVHKLTKKEQDDLEKSDPALYAIMKVSMYAFNNELELVNRKHAKRLRPWLH